MSQITAFRCTDAKKREGGEAVGKTGGGGGDGPGPRRPACSQYLDVVHGFGRRNGGKLAVVKLL